jgi:microcystin-dependent protein
MNSDNQNFLSQTPDLNLWMRFALANFAADINCVSLGTIVSFDGPSQTATVSINYLKIIKGANPNLPNDAPNDQTSDVYLKYPLLIKCPVVVMQGGGAYLTFPINPGDTGLVFFSDRELDTWLTTGQTTYPHNLRTHDLSDAIILLGIRNLTNPIGSYDTQNAAFTFPNGLINIIDKTGERLVQSGMMIAYGGSAAPSGWLLCQGQAVSQTAYAALYAVIGSTYNTGGEGAGNFRIPNMQGNVAVGLLTGDPNFGALGDQLGEQEHTLTIPEMPSHNHGGDAVGGASVNIANVSGSNDKNTQAIGFTGGDGAHNNIQPSLVVNWLIKI